MRLIELEIKNVRGIPHIVLKPNGKNFVIWGPNGSGKSSVVDAIDFLLTGRISRLMGRGTKGITLPKYGPHIGRKPEEAQVRALIQIPKIKEPVEIKRCLARPNELEYDEKFKDHLEPVLEIARRGQHVLTRREILKYITADTSTRAQEIQELLNISELENIRKALVKVKNEIKQKVSEAENTVSRAKGMVNSTTNQPIFHPERVLNLVNHYRSVLGGEPLQELNSTTLKLGLTSPAVRAQESVPNPTLVKKDTQNLLRCLDYEFQATIASHDKSLREILMKVRTDPELFKALKQDELTRMGLNLIDDSGKCPLCDTPWDPDRLREHLEQKLLKAQKAKEYQNKIKIISSQLLEAVTSVNESLQNIISITQIVGEQVDLYVLQDWQAMLKHLGESLSNTIEKYPNSETPGLTQLFAPSNLAELVKRTLAKVEDRYPGATPEQTAWDTLTRLGENLKALENAKDQVRRATIWYTRASILLDHFQAARDNVLNRLYNKVRDRFVELYRMLHDTDEKDFSAKLEPSGAGLNLEVDFYGRGTHPPHALHSEGHQDSMGLCLYLALAEHLTSGLIDLIILDDVVMSVDADHRRQLCTVLATEFKDRQLLITTHDRNWANQLRSEGVVTHAGTIEFFNWKVDKGPQTNHEVDLWERIDDDLNRGDVPSAAAKLRRGSEEYLFKVCDALKAKVQFKLNGKYELGDLMPAAINRYKELLKEAKESAESWNQTDRLKELKELSSFAASVFERTYAEYWAVNPNVHYDQRIYFAANDFIPVIKAFRDLFNLFQCTNCKSLIRYISYGTNKVVMCNCGKFNWNLKSKPKERKAKGKIQGKR